MSTILNLGTCERYIFKINTLNCDQIFFVFFSDDFNSRLACYFSGISFSDKVFNFNVETIRSDIRLDRKMRISKSHFIFKSLGNSSNHIFNVGCDGSDASFLSSLGEPGSNDDFSFSVFLVDSFYFKTSTFFEVSFQGS
mmetsp:Transcript_32243/g.50006  ORF Transcript_32243/g.50006 Transcript_32243/m.50006 type:complete len:139 (-) Transcript_32243:181-597(-)